MFVRPMRIVPFSLFLVVLLFVLALIWTQTEETTPDVAAVPNTRDYVEERATVPDSFTTDGRITEEESKPKPVKSSFRSKAEAGIPFDWRKSDGTKNLPVSNAIAKQISDGSAKKPSKFEQERKKAAQGLLFR